ncbi:hypothetical protein [Sphaerisporangium sp. NPDC051011]|uniref:hypothetical protein n=1 Tax=Sphaerisporangium sp. NPDC051011 TaxID=3155792 RepID=UPI003404E21F
MRFLPLAAVAAIGFTVLTGCSTVDKAQACIEANKTLADMGAKITGVAGDPAAMEKALKDGAAKLEDVAGTAGNTTLNEALQSLADSLKKLNIDNPEEAAAAAQKVATDTARTVRTIAEECT